MFKELSLKQMKIILFGRWESDSNEYNLKPKFYLRYVDNILTAFDNKHDSLSF